MATQPVSHPESRPAFRLSAPRDWRIRTKLLLLFLAFGLVPAGTMSGMALSVFRDTVANMAATSILGRTIGTSHAIDQYLIDRREDIVAASKLPELTAYLANPNDATTKANGLQALKATSGRADYESVAIVSPAGRVILSSAEADVNTDLSFRPYFIEAMQGYAYISDSSVSVVTNRPAIFFSAPIKDPNNKVIGVVRSRLSLNGIWELVEHDKDVEGKGSYGMLLEENGIRIASSQSLGRRDEMEGSMLLYTSVAPLSQEAENKLVAEKRFGNATSTKVQVLALPEIAKVLAAPYSVTFETSSDVNQERNFAAVGSISAKPWRYVVMSPFSSFYGALDTLTFIFNLALVFLVVLILLTARIIAHSFTTPLVQLTQIADRISLGEMDAQIDVNRKDEIGELAEAVSRMQASLQAAIERLRARRAAG